MRPRIRTIKPEFFLHEELFDAERETGLPLRVSYIGLWCFADREGRFRWRPRALGACILPYDGIDFSRVLDALADHGWVLRYACGTREYGCIPTFNDHQVVNNREKDSEIPPPDATDCEVVTSTREARVGHATRSCTSGTGTGTGTGTSPHSPPKGGAPVPYQDFIDTYNRERGDLPLVKVLNDSRRRTIKSAWAECSDLEVWARAFRLAASDAHYVMNTHGMDTIIRPSKRGRWLDGAYADVDPANNPDADWFDDLKARGNGRAEA